MPENNFLATKKSVSGITSGSGFFLSTVWMEHIIHSNSFFFAMHLFVYLFYIIQIDRNSKEFIIMKFGHTWRRVEQLPFEDLWV